MYYQPFPTCSGDTEGACALSADSACWCNPNAFLDGLGGGQKRRICLNCPQLHCWLFVPASFYSLKLKLCVGQRILQVYVDPMSHHQGMLEVCCFAFGLSKNCIAFTRDIKGPISLQWVLGQICMFGACKNRRACLD